MIGTDVTNPMTKAQLIKNCIKKFGFDKETVVLVGDSKYDAIGAQDADIEFIAVTYGFGFKTASDVEVYPHCYMFKCFGTFDYSVG